MKLDERLRLLREEIPQPAPAVEKGVLTERLSRLVPTLPHTAARRVPDERALADVLRAEHLAPGVLRVEHRFGLNGFHGRARLGGCLNALPELMREGAGPPGDWLFLDTETSGLAGGTGTWAFLIGIARVEHRDLVLHQYLLTRLDAEPTYLGEIGPELETAGLLVTFNGKSFDCPLLATRLRLAGIRAGFQTKPHLDLLHPIRRAFARVWPDCRLATAEKRLLGLGRMGDLPGAEAPRAWLAWLRQGETGLLARVLEHNRQDLLSLPALVSVVLESLNRPQGAGADVAAVARYWLARGEEALAFSVLSQDREGLDAVGLLELARLHRRRREWKEARRIWRPLAERGNPAAAEALAKYLEHRERDYVQALALVGRLPTGPAREHRRRRLEAKLRNPASRLLPAVWSSDESGEGRGVGRQRSAEHGEG